MRPVGRLSRQPGSPATEVDTVFDLASITKSVATATSAMLLVDERRLELDAPIEKYLRAFSGASWKQVRVRDLLTHSSGLPAWAPLYREARGKDGLLLRIASLELEYESRTKSQYSDLGMMLLGAIVEQASGEALDRFAERRVFAPLGMDDTGFRPPPGLLSRVAPSSECRWRGRMIQGDVRDENAYAMGGVAGHAGLFSTALDLSLFARMLLNEGAFGTQRLLQKETVALMATRCGVPNSNRSLGWEMAAGDPFSGIWWSAEAYGHTGLTGTALWVDPRKNLFVVLLANRDPVRDESDEFRSVRRGVCERVLAVAGGGERR